MSTLKRRTGKLRRGFAHGIPRVITFSNGKGGTGKTSLTANIGAIAAEAGYHVLLVDLDPQANLIQDLGLEGQADDGEAFANALHKRQALPVIKDVRPNLDVVPGGSKILSVVQLISFNALSAYSEPTLHDIFCYCLEKVVEEGGYDLILIDTPPSEGVLVESAFAASTGVLIPTKADASSIMGVEITADRFDAIKPLNPTLTLLGAVIFGTGIRSTKIDAHARQELAEIFGRDDIVFTHKIRAAEGASIDARREGKLMHEMGDAVRESAIARLRMLNHKEAAEADTEPRFHASNIDGVIGDYQSVTIEFFQRIIALEQNLKEEE